MSKKLTTFRAVAEANGVHRNLVGRLWKLPGAPQKNSDGTFDPSACREFILANSTSERLLTAADPRLRALKAAEIRERTRKLKIHNDAKTETLMLRADHNAIIAGMVSECQRVLEALPQKMAPEVVGLTVPEAEIRLRHAIHESILALKTGKG